ncbi:hypothetical protein B0H16DRAFT_1741051 [Mycena metata]|uniref:Uncharacterized protein n=1 Tax=Mycena metata TaxID=1033252 RepID=A0AAD7HB31_9AGAR|nr:hypothetical protein B0H16DRAFT_1741051 [Mycena metata]
MAEASLPEPDETPHKVKVTAHMLYHTIVPGKAAPGGAKSKVKPKEKKETKAKEFPHTFAKSTENYLALLKAILLKHGEEKKGDSVDVDNFSEYKDLVTDILTGLPAKMNIYTDMADIQKRWSGHGSHGNLDCELARLCGKLEKKYQNDHDVGFTYIDANSGTSVPLTPQMMKEWCCAIYDGEATTAELPEFIASFNPNKRKVALHPARIAASANQPQAPAVSDIGHLASIIGTFVSAGLIPRQSPLAPQAPATPQKQIGGNSASSPVIPTPSKLPCFLEHTSKSLGISSMHRNGFRPDILHLIDDKEFLDMGYFEGFHKAEADDLAALLDSAFHKKKSPVIHSERFTRATPSIEANVKDSTIISVHHPH